MWLRCLRSVRTVPLVGLSAEVLFVPYVVWLIDVRVHRHAHYTLLYTLLTREHMIETKKTKQRSDKICAGLH